MTDHDRIVDPDTGEELDLGERYWAAKSARDLVSALKGKERVYFEVIERRNLRIMWRIMYAQYFGLDPDFLATWETQRIGFDGEDSELVRFRINETRSFVKQLITMATGQRPSFQALAINDDHDSLAQIETSDAIVNYVYEQQYGERKERDAIERASLFGAAHTWVRWDPDGGDLVNVPVPLPDGSPSPLTEQRRAGELSIKVLAPWECVHEPYTSDDDAHLWRIVREKRSRWELAALWPEHAAKIKAVRSTDEYMIEYVFGFDDQAISTDDVLVRHFYHARSPALPEGRYVGIVGDIVLWDLPLPYEHVPVVELCPARYIGTAFGYSDSWDLCAINQMLDQLVSDIATNLSSFGRQVIVVDEGTDYDLDAIANGARVLTKTPSAAMPQAMQFATVPEFSATFVNYLHQRFQSVSGLNSVARGDPSANIKSGTMAALFHSIALEFQSGAQAAVDSHREKLANLILDVLKRYAEHPFVIEVAGADERPYLRSFTKQKLMGVRKVTLKTANPMMRSQAGRLELYGMLSKIPGAVKTPEQAIEIITSGQFKPVYKAARTALLRIGWENEEMLRGVNPQVMSSDNPFKHIPEHLSVLDAPQSAQNKAVVAAVLGHILQHLEIYRSMDPTLAGILGFPAPPQPGMPAEMPPREKPTNGAATKAAAETMEQPQSEGLGGVPLPKPPAPAGGTLPQTVS